MRLEGILVGYHAAETSACTDAFLLCQLLIGYHILTIQLLPRPDDIDVVKRQPYPVLMVLCKVIGLS